MKKILMILALFALPYIGQAQTAAFTTSGIVHTIAPGYISGDSLHYIGLISMRESTTPLAQADSAAFFVTSEDSLKADFYIVPHSSEHAAVIGDTASAAAFDGGANGKLHLTAAGQGVVPWFNIVASQKPGHRARYFKVWVRVYAVGSEVASSGKKFRVTAHRYF